MKHSTSGAPKALVDANVLLRHLTGLGKLASPLNGLRAVMNGRLGYSGRNTT